MPQYSTSDFNFFIDSEFEKLFSILFLLFILGKLGKANFHKIFIPFILNHFKYASPNVRNGFIITGLMPFSFNPDGVDFSKILVQKRKSLAVPTEGVNKNNRMIELLK